MERIASVLTPDVKPPGRRHASLDRPFGLAGWAAGCWTLLISFWVTVGAIQLPAAAGLIELEGRNRGRPLDANDHFSELPQLEAAFDAANLSLQHLFIWILAMSAFAVSGLVIATSLVASRTRFASRILPTMCAIWLLGCMVAAVHYDTLDLVTWLDN